MIPINLVLSDGSSNHSAGYVSQNLILNLIECRKNIETSLANIQMWPISRLPGLDPDCLYRLFLAV